MFLYNMLLCNLFELFYIFYKCRLFVQNIIVQNNDTIEKLMQTILQTIYLSIFIYLFCICAKSDSPKMSSHVQALLPSGGFICELKDEDFLLFVFSFTFSFFCSLILFSSSHCFES